MKGRLVGASRRSGLLTVQRTGLLLGLHHNGLLYLMVQKNQKRSCFIFWQAIARLCMWQKKEKPPFLNREGINQSFFKQLLRFPETHNSLIFSDETKLKRH
jgi:hypothetical protein